MFRTLGHSHLTMAMLLVNLEVHDGSGPSVCLDIRPLEGPFPFCLSQTDYNHPHHAHYASASSLPLLCYSRGGNADRCMYDVRIYPDE